MRYWRRNPDTAKWHGVRVLPAMLLRSGREKIRCESNSVLTLSATLSNIETKLFRLGNNVCPDAWEEGRSAYHHAAVPPQEHADHASAVASIGLVALGAVALTAGYRFTRGMGSGMTNFRPESRGLLSWTRSPTLPFDRGPESTPFPQSRQKQTICSVRSKAL